MSVFTKKDAKKDDQDLLRERMNMMDQELQRTKKLTRELERVVERLETALTTDYSDRGSSALCPNCEADKVAQGDYLCSECRHG